MRKKQPKGQQDCNCVHIARPTNDPLEKKAEWLVTTSRSNTVLKWFHGATRPKLRSMLLVIIEVPGDYRAFL